MEWWSLVIHSAANHNSIHFAVDAVAAVAWCNKTLRSNLSYYRLRRELFEELAVLLDVAAGARTAHISNEVFLALRGMLIARNDDIDDNKRLSFDRAVLELRAAALAAPPAGFIAAAAHMVGL